MKYPSNVKRPGFLSQSEWAKRLRYSDAFVHLAYRDACPKVVIEAIASGIPCLLTTSGGTADLAGYGCCSTISDGESLEINTEDTRLHEFIMNLQSRFFFGSLPRKRAAAQAWARRFNRRHFEDMLSGYFNTFLELI